MQVLRKLVAFLFSMSFVVLVLLPIVHSSQEQMKPVHSHSSTKHKIQKLNPQLSFEIILHGFLLWASMGFLMPIGILIIRMSNREECGRRLKVLFYFHVTLQTLSVLLATAGAVISIKNFENAFDNNHQKIGLVLYSVLWVQAIIAFRRPQRGSKGRSMWFFAHWMLGTGLSILGVISIYTGLQAYQRKTSTSVWLWTVLFTAEICLIIFLYLFQDKWDYILKQGVTLGNEPPTPTPTSTTATATATSTPTMVPIDTRDHQKDFNNVPC